MLVSSAVFEECGLLDEEFFIYYEETEFCRRVYQYGWEIWFVPASGVHHKEGLKYSFSSFREYYLTRNRWLFVRKTQPFHRRLIFYPYFFLRWVLLQVAYLLVVKRNLGAARATVKGAFHAFIGRTGKLES
jgi:GT2 family glycosyltransferase